MISSCNDWVPTSDRHLLQPMINQFTDAYMPHWEFCYQLISPSTKSTRKICVSKSFIYTLVTLIHAGLGSGTLQHTETLNSLMATLISRNIPFSLTYCSQMGTPPTDYCWGNYHYAVPHRFCEVTTMQFMIQSH